MLLFTRSCFMLYLAYPSRCVLVDRYPHHSIRFLRLLAGKPYGLKSGPAEVAALDCMLYVDPIILLQLPLRDDLSSPRPRFSWGHWMVQQVPHPEEEQLPVFRWSGSVHVTGYAVVGHCLSVCLQGPERHSPGTSCISALSDFFFLSFLCLTASDFCGRVISRAEQRPT